MVYSGVPGGGGAVSTARSQPSARASRAISSLLGVYLSFSILLMVPCCTPQASPNWAWVMLQQYAVQSNTLAEHGW
jgi:hypothetical protein